MIQGKWFSPGAPLPEDALTVRRAVFGRGEDALDAESWSAVVYLEGTPAAAGRIWWKDDAFWLGDIGVLESLRGRKLGDLVLRLLLFKAQSHAARQVCLFSPVSLTGFFTRLGFRPSDAEPSPAGLVYLCISGQDIDLDTCKNCGKTSCPNRKE